MFFRDKSGAWWSTFFGNDAHAPFRERPAVFRVRFTKDGRVRPMMSAAIRRNAESSTSPPE
jgi:hypothetical protein